MSSVSGIAGLARSGETLLEKREVDYRSLPSKSVLNRADSPRMPFNWTINPYRGCEIGCKYCYARYTHEFMDLSPQSFEGRVYAKQNVAALLRQELHRVRAGESIAIGTATDPYQPAEKRYGVTREVLEVLLEWDGLDFSITTKSNLVTRDIEILKQLAARHRIGVNITITTLDRYLSRALEPKAPRPDLRLKAISELAAGGIPVGVFVAPVMPSITDAAEALDELAGAAASAGARWLLATPLFLMPSAIEIFFPFLEQAFPDLFDRYRERYAKSAYLPEQYSRGLATLVRRLRAKHGMLGERRRNKRQPEPIEDRQLSLL